MIPENFLPDGKARIISLNILGEFAWDTTGDSDNNLVYPALSFRYVPTTDNMGSTTYGKYSGNGTFAALPSDASYWNGEQSYVDPLSKYYTKCSYIPSPYLGDEFNPVYAVELEGGNALSDFNGLSNTELLVNEGEQYEAAHACWNYKDATNGADGLQWYLPAMGELGFLMSRFQLINQSIQAVGGTPVEEYVFWSSSEYYGGSTFSTYRLSTTNGFVGEYIKNGDLIVRAVSLV